MANSFEFFPRAHRRLAIPRTLPILFVILALVMVTTLVFLEKSNEYSRRAMEMAKTTIEQYRTQIASETKSVQFEPTIATKLKEQIDQHNLALNLPRSDWFHRFTFFENMLPEDGVIAKLDNSKTKSPIFDLLTREFSLLVVLPDLNAVNSLYRKLNELTQIKNLTFDPQGERVYQNRKGVAVQISFLLEEKK